MDSLPFYSRPLTEQEILAIAMCVREEYGCGRMAYSSEATAIAKAMVALKDGNICPPGYGFEAVCQKCVPWIIDCSKN